MIYDLQKAKIIKRIAAGILDLILTIVIAVGILWLLSVIFKYDSKINELNNYYDTYEEQYGIDFREVTEEQYNAYTEEQKEFYNEAYAVLMKDKGFLKVYNLIINLTLVMITIGLLIGTLIIEFVIPILFKNGQTLGKKCFGICVMMQNGVRIRKMPLMVRALLGKFTIEIMIPTYIGIMLLFGQISILHIFIFIALIITELVMIITNKYNALLHDAMSYTVVVDKETQMIFDNQDQLIKYKEEAAKSQEENKKTF